VFCQEKDVYCLYLWSDLFGAMFVFITAFCTCDWNIALRGLLVSVDSMVAPLLFCLLLHFVSARIQSIC